MNKLNSIIVLCICSSITLLTSCKKTTKDPDLLYDFANLQSAEVNSGDPLTMESAILNQEASCNNCSTITSKACDRGIRIEYRADINSPWIDVQLQNQVGDLVFEIVKPVPEIEPGTVKVATEGFVFTTPGMYRYKLASDRSNIVQERDEMNNDATTEDGDIKAYDEKYFRLLVTVVDPSGIFKPAIKGRSPLPVKYLP